MNNTEFTIIMIVFFILSFYYTFLYSPYFYLRSSGSFIHDFKLYYVWFILIFIYIIFASIIANKPYYQQYINDKIGITSQQLFIIILAILCISIYSIISKSLNNPGKYNYYWFNDNRLRIKDANWKDNGITQRSFGSTYCTSSDDTKLVTPLYNLSFCSSYHSPVFMNRYMSNDLIVSPSSILGVIQKGARFIHMDIFGDSVSYFAKPVTGVVREYTNDLVSMNTIPLKDACDAIVQGRNGNNYCSGIPGDDNVGEDKDKKDPIFVYLRLKFDNRRELEDKVADILEDSLGPYLLDLDYSNNLGSQHLRLVLGKIVIITDRIPNGDKLRSFVNGVACGKNITEIPNERFNDSPNKTEPRCPSVGENTIDIFNSGSILSSTLYERTQPSSDIDNEGSSGYNHITICVPNDIYMSNFNNESINDRIKYGVTFPCVPFRVKYSNITTNYFNGYKEYSIGNKSFSNCGILVKSIPDGSIRRVYRQGEIEI